LDKHTAVGADIRMESDQPEDTQIVSLKHQKLTLNMMQQEA